MFTAQQQPNQPSPKLSTLSSIRNGEIPVVVIYLAANRVPLYYQLLDPLEAIVTLATVERLRDTRLASEEPADEQK
jgi:hypothetical protein